MASGDTLCVFTSHMGQPPTANYGTLDTRNTHLITDFDAGTDESIYFPGVLPRHYGSNGVTVRICWMASTATTNEVVWAAAWERHQDDAFDLDGDGFAAAQTVTATAPSASGEVSYDDIAFTDGAQMDSVAVGESFRLHVYRDADDGDDDMTGDAELLRVEVRET